MQIKVFINYFRIVTFFNKVFINLGIIENKTYFYYFWIYFKSRMMKIF